jgi:glyoxylase I family protein
MTESVAFYEKLGFRVVVHWKDPDGELEIAHLKLGTNYLEIFWYRDQAPAPETAASLATDLPRIGVKHFALKVDSVYEAKNFIENRGMAFAWWSPRTAACQQGARPPGSASR